MNDQEKIAWEYWKEPDYPKHEHDWGGVDSDPDHCLGCCENGKEYLMKKIAALEAQIIKSDEEGLKIFDQLQEALKRMHVAESDRDLLKAELERIHDSGPMKAGHKAILAIVERAEKAESERDALAAHDAKNKETV